MTTFLWRICFRVSSLICYYNVPAEDRYNSLQFTDVEKRYRWPTLPKVNLGHHAVFRRNFYDLVKFFAAMGGVCMGMPKQWKLLLNPHLRLFPSETKSSKSPFTSLSMMWANLLYLTVQFGWVGLEQNTLDGKKNIIQIQTKLS